MVSARVLRCATTMRPSPSYASWRRVETGRRRIWQDGERTVAEVYEIESISAEGAARRLVLSQPSGVRRIDSYPSDWHRLDDQRLLALFDEL